MMPHTLKYYNILKENQYALLSKYPISSLALFGSVIREDFDEAVSDIDILVEFNGDIGWEFFDLEQELETIVGRKVTWCPKQP